MGAGILPRVKLLKRWRPYGAKIQPAKRFHVSAPRRISPPIRPSHTGIPPNATGPQPFFVGRLGNMQAAAEILTVLLIFAMGALLLAL
jgi:hypothetical protein